MSTRGITARTFRTPCATLAAAAALVAVTAALPDKSRAAVPPTVLAPAVVGQGGNGTIKGRLVWGGAEAPAPKDLVAKGQASKDPNVCAKDQAIADKSLVVDKATKGVRYGFAYLVQPKGANPEAVKALVGKAAVVEIDQKNCEFVPYSTAIHQDQTLKFKSSDPVNHNVHLSPFTNAPFNLILAPNGETEKKLVAERRVVPLTCDIHPWMKGYIMVFDHPFFAITGEDGSFEIKGVPAGEQKLVVWQESVGYATANLARGMPVTVKAGQVTDVGEVKVDPAKVRK